MEILALLGQLLALCGGLIFVAAAIGFWRFHDPYTRVSAVATASGIGLVLITVGSALQNPNAADLGKVVLAVALQLLTSAIAATVIARAAINSRHDFSPNTDVHELELEDVDAEGTQGAKVSGSLSAARREEMRASVETDED